MPQELFCEEQRLQLILRKRTQLRDETPRMKLPDYYLNDDGLILLISRIIFNSFFSKYFDLLAGLVDSESVFTFVTLKTVQSMDTLSLKLEN